MVGARIPHGWYEQIQDICQETGKSESEVVQEALASYLGQTDLESVQSMNKRLVNLERQYKKLVALVIS